MLFLAAALLSVSMHSAGVIGSTGAPTPTALVQAATTLQADPPTGDSGGTLAHSAVDASRRAAEISTLRSRPLLDALADSSTATLRAAAREGSSVQAAVLDDPPTAAVTAAWWAALPPAVQTRLAAVAPQLVGNLEGVPYAVRDTANRAYLRAALRAARSEGSETASQTAMLSQITSALDVAPGDPPKQLLTIDLRGSGRTSIAVGDLDTARDVTVLVPGMFYTVTGHVVSWTGGAVGLYKEQATLAPVAAAPSSAAPSSTVQSIAAPSSVGRPVTVSTSATVTGAVAPATASATVRAATPPNGVAVIAWMGYRTPDLSNVLSIDLARSGATRLERVLQGIDHDRAADPARVSVVAHSYGSTAALIALSSGRARADSLTVIGSPGSAVTRASQLAVTAGQVFVGSAHWDPVAGTGYFGTDPGAASFGSTVLDLAGGADPHDDGDVFRSSFGHNDYLTPGSASLHDIALIGLGRSDLIQTGNRGRGGQPGASSPDLFLVRPQDLFLQDSPSAV